MPRRTDLKRVLVIGSGPIVIGQACEFDYSGTQACKALRAEGLEVVLVNSNPATIMTDPELADRTYVEPLTPEVLEAIIERERPDALLPTVGGQTALNLAVELAERGVAREVRRRADRRVDRGDQGRRGPAAVPGRDAGDRPRRPAERPRAHRWPRRSSSSQTLGFPLVIRPSFTLGGVGGGIAYNIEEFRELAERGLELSPVHEVLIEESVIGWKEFELEVMRDVADNFVVICSIENIDPMGVHTGDSITVAPTLTLTDKEYQRMRDAARRIIRRVGVETGGSNIQFAVNPANGRMVVIEMNPRVSRSSALASKATGLPDREDRREARARLSPRRDPERHHAPDAGLLRADDRLRRRQDPALELREVPAGRPHADDADEVGGRGDGDRPHVQGSVHEGRPVARARHAAACCSARRRAAATTRPTATRTTTALQQAAGGAERSAHVGRCSARSTAAGPSSRSTS